uniref:MATH domain-containing protein n=1 Tax=Panagrolaimus sp. PS1159 TaxID=55785 RepID=A0AC35GGE8_9BILA
MISLSITGTATIRRMNSATQTEPCPEYRVSSGESSEQVAFQTYTGYIQCRLEEFATFIYESETITSDKIYIGGIPWMIKICSKRVNNASNVIGFYTKCGYDFGKDDAGLNNITANIEMVMKSSNDSSKSHFTRKFNETFTKSHSEWGYSEFRTIEEGFVHSPEKCRRKVQELMTVAKMQAERGILHKAIEANEIAFTLCFEEKDGDIMKDLEKQRDELIEMKLKQSIERLQKDEDASKCAAVPLKSACKHIGVLKKPPKKKNNNQRPKIKLAAPSKPKETRSIGTNTDDAYDPQIPSSELDSNENLRYQTLPQQEAEKVHLMIGLI